MTAQFKQRLGWTLFFLCAVIWLPAAALCRQSRHDGPTPLSVIACIVALAAPIPAIYGVILTLSVNKKS